MPLACTLLESLAEIPDVSTHLVVSKAARAVLEAEGGSLPEGLATVHDPDDFASPLASGSWLHDGMIVCPCSMRSLAAIASGLGCNLIHRAADVCLKERRRLILVPRETPFSHIHLKNMLAADQAGALVMPFIPAYYTGAASLAEMERCFVGRLLDQLGLANSLAVRWQGKNKGASHDQKSS